MGIVTGCDQQGGGSVGADSSGSKQRRVGLGAETMDLVTVGVNPTKHNPGFF